jgi:hypothetical protein
MRKILLMSTAVLMSTAAHADILHCGAPTVFLGDDGHNTVSQVNVEYNPDLHGWSIEHLFTDGTAINRATQYAIRDASNDYYSTRKWEGPWLRNPALYMVGEYDVNGYYQEWLYKRGQLVMHSGVRCQFIRPTPPPVVHTVPVVPVPVPVAPAPAAIQQNGPVVVAPPSSNNVTITIVPGTTWSPQPKVEPKPEGGS